MIINIIGRQGIPLLLLKRNAGWCPVTDYTLFITITQYIIYIFIIIIQSIYSLLKGAAVVLLCETTEVIGDIRKSIQS